MKPHFPTIDPLPNNIHRPFWSVMIPAFNGTKYLAETLESVLQQDPGADVMQIEVVDDCSTKDDPEALVREIGKGRVSFHRNPHNLGSHVKNWDVCIQRAHGHWVHVLHQDDLVLPGFYEKLRSGIEQAPEVGAAFCRNIFIDEEGTWMFLSDIESRKPEILSNWVERIATFNKVQCPAIVVKRSTYETIGGFSSEARSAADWEMWMRIAAYYPVWHEPQPLASYRLHTSSISSGLIQRGDNIADTYQAIEVAKSYLPPHLVRELSTKAQVNYAFHALTTAREGLEKGELKTAVSQLKQGLRHSYHSLNIFKSGVFVSLLVGAKILENNFHLTTKRTA